MRNDSCISSNTILLSSVLQLLEEQLEKLSRSSFFADELSDYITELRATVSWLEHDIGAVAPQLSPDFVAPIVDAIWHATQFLTGTTSNRVPYEVTYLLREVLLDWHLGDSIVTTSLIQSPDFYCESVGRAPSEVLRGLTAPKVALSKYLVQIGMPEIFQHMPLFCAPLYHELAHYIDQRSKIIKKLLTSREADVAAALPAANYFPKPLAAAVVRDHVTEHFCDLFAACYVGGCVTDYISQWSQNGGPERTHPLPEDRAQLTSDFLAGTPNALIDLLRDAVSSEEIGFELIPRYTLPNVEGCFRDVRPASISELSELHGLLPAADAFLKKLLKTPEAYASDPIGGVPPARRVALVNDLVEKSIRNFMISKAWNDSLA